MFPTTWQSLWEWKCKMWQKYRLLSLQAKKPEQPWNNLCTSVPSVSLLVYGVMWISGPGVLLSAETSRKKIFMEEKGQRAVLGNFSQVFWSRENTEQWREGDWFFLGLCKDMKRGKRGVWLLGETGRQVIILLYWYHDQAISPGLWNPLRPWMLFFIFSFPRKRSCSPSQRPTLLRLSHFSLQQL